MEYSYIKAYFNSSDESRNDDYKLRCKDPNNPNAICKVPDQTTPPDPSKSLTTFLTPNKGVPSKDNPPTAPPPDDSPPEDPIPDNPVVAPVSPGQPGPEPISPVKSGPDQPSGKTVTPDASCGGEKRYTCLGGTFGDCCSSYGFWYVFQSPMTCPCPNSMPKERQRANSWQQWLHGAILQ